MKNGAKPQRRVGKSIKSARHAQQMRDLVNCNLDGILVIGLDGRALFANPAACTLLNRPLEEILDHEIGLPFSGEDYTELEILRPDGGNYTVEMRVHRMEWEDQPALLADLRDITWRKQAEKSLRVGEEKMRSIFRVAPTGIGIVRDRMLLDVNPRICEMIGYTKEELVGQSARILYPTQEEFDFVGQEKYRQIAQKGTGQVETRWRKKDGSIMDILLASTPMDLSDLSKGVTFTALDITERKQAETALRESEDKFKYVFDNSIVAKSITSADGKLHVNRAFSEMLGYSEEELNNIHWREFTHPDDIELNLRETGEVLAGKKESARFIKRYIHKNGGVVWVDLSTSLRRDANGNPIYFVTTALDITESKHAEDRLRLLAEMLDNAPNSITVHDLQGNFLYANQKCLTLHGYDLDEFMSLNLRDLDVPESESLIAERIRRIQAEGSVQFEVGHYHKDGSVIPLEVFAKIVTWGAQLASLSIATDITERRQAEEALRKSEERFELAMLAVNDGIWDWDIANDKVYFDQRYFTMAGYEPNEFPHIVEEWSKRIHPDDIERSMEKVNAHLAGETKVFDIEFRFRRKDGTWMWIRGRGRAVKRDEGGRVIRMIGTHSDITDRKQAEDAVRKSERQMKALLTSLDDIVFEFDEKGTYLDIWTADESLLAQPKAQMLGKRVFEVMGREQGSSFYNAIKRVLAKGIPESLEYPLDVIGGQRWFMARFNPILSPDSTTRSVSVLVRDITERKRVEQQVQIQLQRVRALNEIDRAISSSMDMSLSLDILLNELLSQLGVDAAAVLLLNPASQTLEYTAGKGFRSTVIRESRITLGQGFPGRTGLERRVMHVPDIKAEEDKFLRKKLLKEEEFVEYLSVPLIAKGLLKGVLEIFNRTHLKPDMEWMNYLETLGGQAAIAIDNAQLFEGMQRSNLELVVAYDATIEGWSHAMDLRDKETEGHTLRVTEWTEKLARKMGVSQQEMAHMRRGALLHDIGKLGVPDHILNKPGKLDEVEWGIMHQHPMHAFNMLMSINYLRPALDIPYCHHEKWDGSGYPRGLKGEEIPLAARIFAVVDVWDALRSDRPYRTSWTVEKTREFIVEESGRHFDPQVVEAFLEIIEGE